jgi:hypothetical protein
MKKNSMTINKVNRKTDQKNNFWSVSLPFEYLNCDRSSKLPFVHIIISSQQLERLPLRVLQGK